MRIGWEILEPAENQKKKGLKAFCSKSLYFMVELGGIEPPTS